MPAPSYHLGYTRHAAAQLAAIRQGEKKRCKKVEKILGQINTAPTTYPGLHSHKIDILAGYGAHGEDIWVSYLENDTPGAWRVLWYFDSTERGLIVITSIEPHSD